MHFNGHELTGEQTYAIDLALTREDLKIEAYAGSGKTFTLTAIGDKLGTNGIYIAFNRAIVQDLKKKINQDNISCYTAHGLAFKDVGRTYAHRLKRLTGKMLAWVYLKLGSGLFGLSLSATGNAVLDTINNYSRSADRELSTKHVPYGTAILVEEVTKIDRKDFYNVIVPYARKVWERMIDPEDNIPITHDIYLKIWALSYPVIRKDFILFDECQDANAIMLDIVKRQPCQKIYVGDKYQSIYGWRGAVNAVTTPSPEGDGFLRQA